MHAARGDAPPGARHDAGGGLAATLRRSPLLRLLAGGALLAVALHVLGGPGSTSPRSRTIAGAAPWPPAAVGGAGASADDELLYRTAAAAVSVDDPVVRGRLLRLAQYLEMGGTAEEPDDVRAAGADEEARRQGNDELIAAARDVGLAGEDVVLRRYLAELARLALARPARADLPDEGELRAWVAAHPERFSVPARVRARHVYLSGTRRGARLAADAATLLDELRGRGVTPERGTSYGDPSARGSSPGDPSARVTPFGDPFARGDVIDGSHDVLARAFGEDFACALDALPVGSWQGPIASPFGLHLVWIEERAEARPASFDEVRGRALHAFLRERGEARAKRRLALLRCRMSGREACAG